MSASVHVDAAPGQASALGLLTVELSGDVTLAQLTLTGEVIGGDVWTLAGADYVATSGETLNQQLLGTSVELLTVKFVGDPIVAIDGDDVAAEGDEADAPAEDATEDEPEVASDESKAESSVSLAAIVSDDANQVAPNDAAPTEKEDGPTETTEKEPADDGKPDSE